MSAGRAAGEGGVGRQFRSIAEIAKVFEMEAEFARKRPEEFDSVIAAQTSEDREP